MYSLSDLIIPNKLQNTTPYGCVGNATWDTYDRVYLESIPEFEANAAEQDDLNKVYPTGYALINRAIPYNGHGDLNWKLMESKVSGMKPACNIYLRSNYENKVAIVNNEGEVRYTTVDNTGENVGVRPCMNLDVQTYLKIVKGLNKIGYWGSEFQIGKNSKWNKPFIKLGEFPQAHACRNTTFYQELNHNYCDVEKEEQVKVGDLIPTGRTFMGSYDPIVGRFREGVEYEYNLPWPIKMVRYHCDDWNIGYWLDVEPIVWEILNWNDLPKEINPEGNGRAAVIKLRTQKALLGGMPFNINQEQNDANLWQNSTLRGYLNGYNMQSIKNQNIDNFRHIAFGGGDFTQRNFLNETMGRVKVLLEEINRLKTSKKSKQTKTKKNALKTNLQATELTK